MHSFICVPPDTLSRGRLAGALKCNSATAPGLLLSRYTSASGELARRQWALPSSQVTPLYTCPGLRPRWFPGYSPLTHPGLLPSTVCKVSAFLLVIPRSYPNDQDYTYFGAQYKACTLASSGFGLPLPGLPADVTTDLLAKL
jgi:hypothetical protein